MEIEDNSSNDSDCDNDENSSSPIVFEESDNEDGEETSKVARLSGYPFKKNIPVKLQALVMRAVSLSARKKYLKDFLEQLLVLRSRAVEDNFLKRLPTDSYVCCGCWMWFPDESLLTDHFNRGTSRLCWRCSICWKTFDTKNLCEATFHGPAYHIDNNGKFPVNIPIELIGVTPNGEATRLSEVCPECRKDVGSVISHIWTEDLDDTALHCPYCYVFFTRNACRYNLHVRVHKNMAPFRCPDCAKVFKNGVELESHLKEDCRHAEYVPRFRCSVCELVFRTDVNLRKHIFSQHNLIKYTCNICNTKLDITSEKNSHFDLHHRGDLAPDVMRRTKSFITEHQCLICGSDNLNGFKYERHVRAHFKNHLFKISLYVCDCGFLTCFKSSYLMHKSTPCVTDYFSVIKDSSAIMKKCVDCEDIKFYNGNEPFSCEECSRFYGDSNFRYKCVICLQHLYFSMENVIVHLIIDHGKKTLEIPYKYINRIPHEEEEVLDSIAGDQPEAMQSSVNLDSDDSSYIESEQEDLEEVDNTDEDSVRKNSSSLDSVPDDVELAKDSSTMFKCCDCSKSFVNQDHLRIHFKTVHPENKGVFHCPECSVVITSFESYTIHLQSHWIEHAENNTSYENDEPAANSLMQHGDEKVALLCPVCKATSSSPVRYQQHLRSHGMAFFKKKKTN